MKRKLVLIDIDGTLTDDKGRIPRSTKLALQKAREKGNLVYLCTGRSQIEYTSLLRKIEVDGVIGAGGGSLEMNGEKLYDYYFQKDKINHLLTYFNSHSIQYYLTAPENIIMDKRTFRILKIITIFIGKKYRQCLKQIDQTPKEVLESINKINFINKRIPYEKIASDLKEYTMTPSTIKFLGENSGEIVITNISKKVGIENLLRILDISKENAIGIGNGLNDIELMNAVNVKVAIADAPDALLEKVDYITDIPKNDGIYKIFEKLNLF